MGNTDRYTYEKSAPKKIMLNQTIKILLKFIASNAAIKTQNSRKKFSFPASLKPLNHGEVHKKEPALHKD